jgi:hypothetical protein
MPELPEVKYEWRTKVYYAEKTDAEQSYVRMGHIGGLQTDPDYADRIVMNSVLGGGFGSRVVDEVRTKLGLAYSSGGLYRSNLAYPGYFFISASTKPESTVKAARAMRDQIESMLTDKPTDQEMRRAKDGYLNSFVFNFDSPSEVINRMMTYDFYGLPEDFLQKEKERVEQVTPDDVMAAAQRNLKPDQMFVLVVGNAEEFDESLEALDMGPVEKIDISIPKPEVEEVELTISDENVVKGRELMAASVEWAGGQVALKSVNSVEQKGKFILSMGEQQLPIDMHVIEILPDQSREVMTFMGQNIYSVRNGDVGWKTNQQTMQLVDMSSEDIQDARDQLLRDFGYLYKTFGSDNYTPVYAGAGDFQGTPVDWIAIVDANDETQCRLALSADDHSLVGQTQIDAGPMGEGLQEIAYGDYETIEGVQMPMTRTVTQDGQQIIKVQVAECVVNGPVPEDAFAKPE